MDPQSDNPQKFPDTHSLTLNPASGNLNPKVQISEPPIAAGEAASPAAHGLVQPKIRLAHLKRRRSIHTPPLLRQLKIPHLIQNPMSHFRQHWWLAGVAAARDIRRQRRQLRRHLTMTVQ